MVTRATLMLTLLIASLLIVPARSSSHEVLPVEPELATRLDELYDHEARLFIMLYSLKGNGQVDYVTGRLVQEYARSNYGNPIYQTEESRSFTGGCTMWNDPEQDGERQRARVSEHVISISALQTCTANPVVSFIIWRYPVVAANLFRRPARDSRFCCRSFPIE
jgi:hypothetical protein